MGNHLHLHDWIFGRLSWASLPTQEIIDARNGYELISGMVGCFAALVAILGLAATVWIITRQRWWTPLWQDWVCSVDHKKIGVMYIALAWVMLARAVMEAVVMRTQQVVGYGGGGLVSPDHFGQLFSTHGTIMIFFMAMPFLTGLMNFAMPLQIGARDVSFPVLNSVSLALTVSGAALVMISLVFQPFSTGGWSGYPPFTENRFSPGPGPDYWIWALTLSSVASTLTGINFAVTLYKERAPGMTLMRMPMFCWTTLCTSILMVFAMPPLTVATLFLALDRYLGFHFFTNDAGGNAMNFVNLFWLFGHPEVYILILPAFGIYSEVISTFSGKRLYGYPTLVAATMCIAVLSFTVWVHHFFTMGQSAALNAVFGVATMLIGVPTGVKIYDWMLTMFRGRVRMSVPMVYSVAFIFLFVVGGSSGILLANPTIDYQVHNTVFLVAHFHNVLIPGTLFGLLAGYTFWFPKAFGFRLDDRWGYRSAGCWIIGFILAFMPLYLVGLQGMPRRLVSYTTSAYLPYLVVAGVGAVFVSGALVFLLVQLCVSIRHRDALAVPVGDPWDGRSLEWSIPCPAPEYNFFARPHVVGRDPFTSMKEAQRAVGDSRVRDRRLHATIREIKMPQDSPLGAYLCFSSLGLTFGLVWHIWWLCAVSLLLTIGLIVAHGWRRETPRVIPAAKVAQDWREWHAAALDALPVTRRDEQTEHNQGRAIPAALEAT